MNEKLTASSRRVPEKAKDRIFNLGGIVEVQIHSDAVEESVVGVLLGNLTASESVFGNDEDILWLRSRSSKSEAEEGNEHSDGFVLHDVG